MTDDSYRPAGRPDLYLPDGELPDFVGWLESAVETLRSSRLSPEQLSDLRSEAGQFGESSAAAELFSRYEEIRARLEGFVRIQQDAIEMLGITTTLVENDYTATEMEQIERLQQITAHMDELYSTPGPRPGDDSTGGGGAQDMAQ
ncbi:hypothetical protein [Streptomyces sp. MP131-18]|uniref:hypothetical protein n=1 Tax=Streptomyces sp. MP131-18 TaxID=1857892 RepID=UPI00097BBE83|nr:hypothetical protein [Streptomyces sp. MP131-18]ONK10821.1 hypothetical protein STBA_15460 [Streptomyces sp. MP131-18]